MSFVKVTTAHDHTAGRLPDTATRTRTSWANKPKANLRLNRAVGNQALQRLLDTGVIQARLLVNQPGDIYEQEADRVADQVMRMPDPASAPLQRQYAFSGTAGPNGECEACKAKRLGVQRKESNRSESGTAPQIVHDVIGGAGQPLDSTTRGFFEPRFGYDFGGVRVHTGVQAAESARVVNALAYTVGNNIVFGVAQHRPGTEAGQRLLAHELAHVIQQEGIGPSKKRFKVDMHMASGPLGQRSLLARQATEEERAADETSQNDQSVSTQSGAQPKDMRSAEAAEFGRDALAAVGYDELIELAIQAGFLTNQTGAPQNSGMIQRKSRVPQDIVLRQAATFGQVFSRYAVAAGIASQVDSPAPGPGDAVALGILAVGLVAAGISVLSRPKVRLLPRVACPPCPPNPLPEIDRVPPSTPHWPCPGDHWHQRIYNQNPVTCQCFLSGRLFGGCCGTPGAPC